MDAHGIGDGVLKRLHVFILLNVTYFQSIIVNYEL